MGKKLNQAPDLDSLLSYKNADVIKRYEQDFPYAHLSPATAFSELMKFMWISLKHRHELSSSASHPDLQFTCVIHEEMKEIDNIWHTFLLFTKDYQHFCDHYLGGFFHHQPITQANENMNDKLYAAELDRYLSYIHDHLGIETLVKWFGTPTDQMG